MRSVLVLVLAFLVLGCAGLTTSVPIEAHLDQSCALAAEGVAADLADLDRPAAPIPAKPRLELRADGSRWLDGLPSDDLPTSTDGIAVIVERGVPAERVVALLGPLHAAGFTHPRFVARSKERLELPPFPDPELGAEIVAELAALDPSERAVRLADRISGEISLCPGAQKAFAAIAAVRPEDKCTILARALDESLPMCPITNGDRVVTVVQAATQPIDPFRPTVLELTLDPAAEPLVVAPSMPWQELLDTLATTPASWITVGG